MGDAWRGAGLRVLLDTNVLVSAFFWDGNERAVLEACIDGEHDLGTSVFILNELGRVLREKFEVSAGRVAGYIGQLVALAQVVDPDPHLDVIEEDPTDNRILEAALALQADVIVSGDSDLLGLKRFEGMEIRQALGTLHG